MKFTHRLFKKKGWTKTAQIPSDFKEIKHLGKCAIDGDMFAAYNDEGEIHIFKGVLEEPLKTDTWYKNKYSSLLVYRTGDKRNYGILDNEESNYQYCFTPENWQEATNEEVKEALVKVAKKKGFKNIGELRLKSINGNVYAKGCFRTGNNKFTFVADSLFLDDVEIFEDGKWAEILEEEKEKPLTILDIEERLKSLEERLKHLEER